MHTMFIATLAFFSRISDYRIGSTYMTLLNTFANLAFMWTSTAALGMIDVLALRECSLDSTNDCFTQNRENVRNYIILIIIYYSIK